jgi:hypothetical protein
MRSAQLHRTNVNVDKGYHYGYAARRCGTARIARRGTDSSTDLCRHSYVVERALESSPIPASRPPL